MKRPVGWVEREPTKNRTQHSFQEQKNLKSPKTELNPTHYDTNTVSAVGFRYTYLPERFIEEWNAVYSENALVVLPLNPTYVYICILFFNPRLIIKLTFNPRLIIKLTLFLTKT